MELDYILDGVVIGFIIALFISYAPLPRFLSKKHKES